MTGCSISANCHFMLIAWCSPPLCSGCWSQAMIFPLERRMRGASGWNVSQCVTIITLSRVTHVTRATTSAAVSNGPQFTILVEGNLTTVILLRTRSTRCKNLFQALHLTFRNSSFIWLIRPVSQDPGQLNNINRPWLILDKGCSHKLLLPYGSDDVASEMNLK